MAFETPNLDEIDAARRKAIAESIRPISIVELKALGEKIFPMIDHPWRETFFKFIAEHASSDFRHATTNDHIQFVYCRDQNKGLWFLPGRGMGPLQPKGLEVMRQVLGGGAER